MNRFLLPAILACTAIATGIVFAASQNDSTVQETTVRYSVSGAGDSAVLVDSTKGQTWLLHRSVTPRAPHAWIQIKRFDDTESAQNWRSEQRDHQLKRLSILCDDLNEVYKKLHISLKDGVDTDSPEMRILERRVSSLEWRVSRLEQSQDTD